MDAQITLLSEVHIYGSPDNIAEVSQQLSEVHIYGSPDNTVV